MSEFSENQKIENPPYLLVRLRPGARGKPPPVQRYDYRLSGSQKYLTFQVPGQWNKVPVSIALKLREVTVHEQSPASPHVFDVMTEDEARVLDNIARAEREAKKAIEEPSVDTAIDLMYTDVETARQKALRDVDKRASGVKMRASDLSRDSEDDEEVETEIHPEAVSFSTPTPVQPLVEQRSFSGSYPPGKPSLAWLKRELLAYAEDKKVYVPTSATKPKILDMISRYQRQA